MNNQIQTIINIPSFLYKIYDPTKLNFLGKVLLLIYGKFIQLFFNNTNYKTFCYIINLLIPKYSNIHFKNGYYFKNLFDEQNIYYPNKRISRVIGPRNEPFETLFKTYCLDKIKFSDGDTVIDCGANIGELNFCFYFKNLKIKYIAFEPDSVSYNCLIKNKIRGNEEYHKLALSNKVGEEKFFLDSYGGNSSIVYFGNKNYEIVQTATLDSLNIEGRIKLLKLEAEGFEPEILEGSVDTIKKIEYISVDFGAERGINEESTIIDVNNFLIDHNFVLYDFSKHRMVGLYKNKLSI